MLRGLSEPVRFVRVSAAGHCCLKGITNTRCVRGRLSVAKVDRLTRSVGLLSVLLDAGADVRFCVSASCRPSNSISFGVDGGKRGTLFAVRPLFEQPTSQ